MMCCEPLLFRTLDPPGRVQFAWAKVHDEILLGRGGGWPPLPVVLPRSGAVTGCEGVPVGAPGGMGPAALGWMALEGGLAFSGVGVFAVGICFLGGGHREALLIMGCEGPVAHGARAGLVWRGCWRCLVSGMG